MLPSDQASRWENEPVLSVRGAARRLGLTAAAVHELCARGELRHMRVLDVIRIPTAALPDPGLPAAGRDR